MGENNNSSNGSSGNSPAGDAAIKSELTRIVSPVLQPALCQPPSLISDHLMPSPSAATTTSGTAVAAILLQGKSTSSPSVLSSSPASYVSASAVASVPLPPTPHLNPYSNTGSGLLDQSAQQSLPLSSAHLLSHQQQLSHPQVHHQQPATQQHQQPNYSSASHSLHQQHPHLQNQRNASPPAHQAAAMYTSAEYLATLLKDQRQISAFPGVFFHLERLLNEEINRVRSSLFQISGAEKKPLMLPEPEGPVICKSDKILVPIDKHPEYNFVGRILGPRGMTAKQLEHETGCKIMVRGKGSMRDRKKEEQNRGKPNWEHLNEPLHVLITCEDSCNRAEVKLMHARDEVEKLLVPVADGEDDLKKRQLMELAIINGTYRDSGSKQQQQAQGLESESQLKSMHMPMMRHPGLGAPLIIGPQHLLAQHLMQAGGHPSLLSQHHADPATALFYTNPYDFGRQYAHNLLAASAPHLLEFQTQSTNPGDQLAAGDEAYPRSRKRQRAS